MYEISSSLVDLFDRRTVLRRTRETSRSTARCTSREASRRATGTSSTVQFLHDGVGNGLELLLLLLVLLLGALLRGIEPGDSLVDGCLELRLVSRLELVGELLVGKGVTEVVGIRLETVLGGDTSSSSLVLSYKKDKSVSR